MLVKPFDPSASRIEVSGWDEDEVFFVEKSEFACDELLGKHITLQHSLPDGSLIYLRLLHTFAPQNSTPIAYQARFIGYDVQGYYQFKLFPAYPLHPNSSYQIN